MLRDLLYLENWITDGNIFCFLNGARLSSSFNLKFFESDLNSLLDALQPNGIVDMLGFFGGLVYPLRRVFLCFC